MQIKNLAKKELLSLLSDINKTPLKYRSILNTSDKIYFGNEIEVDNLDEEKTNMIVDILNNRYLYSSYDYFYAPKETTCDSEIATPPLTNTEYNWKLFLKAYDMISGNGGRATENTSSHIHVSSDLINTNKKLITFLKIVFTFEDIIFKFGYGYLNEPRKYILADTQPVYAALLNPEYINSYIEALNTSTNLNNHLTHLKTHNRLDYINFKYFNINKFLITKKEEDHIEFRNFNGTVYPEIAQNNINLALNIIDAINEDRIDIDLLNSLYELEYAHKKYYIKIIKNSALFFYKDSYPEYNKLLRSYSIPNIRKALTFADMIYTNDLDKYYFLKQYLKLFNKREEDIKKITM